MVYYKYELSNVLVTSYRVAGDAGYDTPEEVLSLSYEGIKVTYTELDAAGKKKGSYEFTLGP